MHPGILPKNRGLDPHKWAILKNWPQGVTCHLINEKIDLGKLINKKIIKVFNDDTLVDINYRLDNTSLKITAVGSATSATATIFGTLQKQLIENVYLID